MTAEIRTLWPSEIAPPIERRGMSVNRRISSRFVEVAHRHGQRPGALLERFMLRFSEYHGGQREQLKNENDKSPPIFSLELSPATYASLEAQSFHRDATPAAYIAHLLKQNERSNHTRRQRK